MADIYAEATTEFASAQGPAVFTWWGTYDDVARVLNLECREVNRETQQPLDPLLGVGGAILTLSNGQTRTVDFFAQGWVNAGPQVISNLNLRVSGGGRSPGLTVRGWFDPEG